MRNITKILSIVCAVMLVIFCITMTVESIVLKSTFLETAAWVAASIVSIDILVVVIAFVRLVNVVPIRRHTSRSNTYNEYEDADDDYVPALPQGFKPTAYTEMRVLSSGGVTKIIAQRLEF